MEVRSLVRHKCHNGNSQRFLLFLMDLGFSLDRSGRWRRRGWRSFLMARTLTELPAQEDEEGKEEDERRRDLAR
jgi:hypothetical protein